MLTLLVTIIGAFVIGFIKGTAVTLAVILAISIALIKDLSGKKSLKKVSEQIIFGYIFRLILLFIDLYGKSIIQLPNSGADSNMFYRTSVEFMKTGNPGRGELFSVLMGTIFNVTGDNRLFGQFVIMLFSIVAICAFAEMLEVFEIDDLVRRRSVGIVCLLPNFAILSSIFLRESVVTMCISLSLLFFSRWLTKGKTKHLAISFIIVLIGSLFHSGCAGIAMGYVIAIFIGNRNEKRFEFTIKNVITSGFLLFILGFLYLNYGGALFSKMQNISSISSIGSTYSEGGSSYARYVGNSNSIGNMIIYTIPRIVYFLFSPFPWQWRGINDIIATLFSSLFYIFSVKNSIQELGNKNKYDFYIRMLLVVTFCVVFVFAWGVTNTGTATRHRDKLVVLFGLIYALSLKNQRIVRIKFGDRSLF